MRSLEANAPRVLCTMPELSGPEVEEVSDRSGEDGVEGAQLFFAEMDCTLCCGIRRSGRGEEPCSAAASRCSAKVGSGGASGRRLRWLARTWWTMAATAPMRARRQAIEMMKRICTFKRIPSGEAFVHVIPLRGEKRRGAFSPLCHKTVRNLVRLPTETYLRLTLYDGGNCT